MAQSASRMVIHMTQSSASKSLTAAQIADLFGVSYHCIDRVTRKLQIVAAQIAGTTRLFTGEQIALIRDELRKRNGLGGSVPDEHDPESGRSLDRSVSQIREDNDAVIDARERDGGAGSGVLQVKRPRGRVRRSA